MRDKIDLKPCPFCGGKQIGQFFPADNPKLTFVCFGCGANVVFDPNKNGLHPSVSWNRRTTDEK